MRVLIVSQYFWPENFRINDLATDLVAKGHRVTVLTGLPNYPDGNVLAEYRRTPEKYHHLNGVEIVRVPLLARGNGGLRLVLNYLSFALMACILGPWKLRGRIFDVVFVNQLSPVTVGLPGALLSRIKKAPMAMWVLDLWPDTLEAIGVTRSQKLLRLVGGLVSLIYKSCDLVLTQSKSFIPAVRRLAPANLAVEYLPSWAEDVFQESSSRAVEIPLKEGSFDVLFAGNIGEAQDFPCILNAAEAVKDQKHIRWLIVGDGRMKQWVEKEIQRRDLNEQVLLLGRFPLDRMPAFYQGANALLVTLQNKPIFGMTIPGKLQSYLAAGRPIVAALNGEGADLIRESAAGVVCAAGDHAALAASVCLLASLSAEDRYAMGECGLRLSRQHFSRKVVLDRLEEMLLSMAKIDKKFQIR